MSHKYFTEAELCKSAKAARLKIQNEPNGEQILNMSNLIDKVLDPAREEIGHAVYVSSGFRCAALNSAAGGETNSQHRKGEAADLVCGSVTENARLGRTIYRQGRFDQLIFEGCAPGTLMPAWVHVSCKRSGTNRRQVLMTIAGKKGYFSVDESKLK